MYVQYLFDSSGNWIAFRSGDYVYTPEGDWVGWLPWKDNDVVDTQGRYLGTIFYENRLYRIAGKPFRGYPGFPGYPGYPGYPGFPGYGGFSPLPPGTADVALNQGSH